MVLLKIDVDGRFPPKYESVVGDDDGDDFPSRREIPPTESLHRREKVILPKFCLQMAMLRPESPPLIFFLGHNDLYTRRWSPEVGRGGHNAPGRAWAPWHAQVGCAHMVAPLW